jgi:hypothetical protein
VVANTLQGSEKSNGNSANSHTNNTPAADSQSQDPTNIEDGGSSYEEECCELAPHISEDCIDCVSGRSLPESLTAEMAVVGRRRPYTILRSSINH